MKLSLIRSMTRSAVFELENGLCYRPAHPFRVKLNGQPVCSATALMFRSVLSSRRWAASMRRPLM